MKVLEQTGDGSIFILEGDFSDQRFRKIAAGRALSKHRKSGKSSGKFTLDKKPVKWDLKFKSDHQIAALFEEGEAAFGLNEEDLSSLLEQVNHDASMRLVYKVLEDIIPDMIPAIKLMVEEDLLGAMKEVMDQASGKERREWFEENDVELPEVDRNSGIADQKIDSLSRLANLTVMELEALADKYASQHHNIW